MIQKFKLAILTAAITFTGVAAMVPAVAHADFKGDACDGINTLSGGSSGCSSNGDKAINTLGHTIIQIFSIIVGFISVVMVIIGGLRYITANGDSSAAASARSTIVYALIGLVVVAIAQVLVHFVLFKTSTALK